MALRHPRWMLFSFASIGLTGGALSAIAERLLPSTDSGQITLTTKAAPDTSLPPYRGCKAGG